MTNNIIYLFQIGSVAYLNNKRNARSYLPKIIINYVLYGYGVEICHLPLTINPTCKYFCLSVIGQKCHVMEIAQSKKEVYLV